MRLPKGQAIYNKTKKMVTSSNRNCCNMINDFCTSWCVLINSFPALLPLPLKFNTKTNPVVGPV